MKKDMLIGLGWAGGILLLAFAAKFAHEHGYISADTTLRTTAMSGLMAVYYANRAPKAVAPRACMRQFTRFSGWTLVLSGLVYAGLWAFAPIPMAMTVGTGTLAAGLIVTLGYCVWLRVRPRANV